MSVYPRGNVWHYEFVLDGDRYRGSTNIKGAANQPKPTNKAKAETVEALAYAAAKEHKLITKRCETLAHLMVRFKEYLLTARTDKGEMKPASKRNYQNGMRMLGSTKLGDMRLNKITQEECNRHIRGDWATKANINVAIRTLRRLLHQAVEWKVLGVAPKLHTVKLPGRQITYTVEEEEAMIAAAPQPLRDVLICMFGGCSRNEEVYRMRIENIQWNRKRVFIPGGKTDTDRHIPMTDRMEIALLMRCGDRKEGWVFPCKISKSGKPQSPTGHLTTIAKAWADLRTKLGLPKKAVPYCIRHTALTELMERTGDLKLVMEIAGHTDPATAMKYQHPALERARLAMEKRYEKSEAL